MEAHSVGQVVMMGQAVQPCPDQWPTEALLGDIALYVCDLHKPSFYNLYLERWLFLSNLPCGRQISHLLRQRKK